jgi:hypothetical protein
MGLLGHSKKLIMHHIKKFLFCLFLIPMVFSAQEATYAKNIADYLDINGTMLQYEFTYSELLKIISKQEVLTTEITKVSESRSKGLYETSLSLLNNG